MGVQKIDPHILASYSASLLSSLTTTARGNVMNDQRYRILIFDVEEDTLLTLQHTLENAGADTTITWDETEARQLVERKPFDLIIVGDHPPEIRAESILHDSSFQSARHPCLILLGHVLERDIEHFRRLGAMGVIPKRDPLRVLEQVPKHWCPETVTGCVLADARSQRVAA
jgi:CheY-like chemotaxis protein